jgi:hypothetical protein
MDNVVSFETAARSKDAYVDTRMGDICVILMWSAAMYKSGRMPQDIAEAFSRHFKEGVVPGWF